MVFNNTKGFSIIEVMVGSLLSLLVIASLLSTLGSYYQNRTLHLSRSYVQYNGSHAINSIANALKYNFFEGCKIKTVGLRSSSFGPPVASVASELVGGPNPDFPITDLRNESFLAFDYDNGGNPQPAPPTALISAALANLDPRPRPNSSVFLSYNTSIEMIETTVDMTTPGESLTIDSNTLGLAENNYALITNCFMASIFRVNNTPTTSIDHDDFQTNYGAGSEIRRVYVDIFYVADSLRTDQGGNPVYSLYRSRNGQTQEIAEGINLLKVQLLEEVNQSTRRFVLPTDTFEWNMIKGARIGLIATSIDLPAFDVDSKTYQILTDSYTPADLSGEFATKNYKQVFTSTVYLRNRG